MSLALPLTYTVSKGRYTVSDGNRRVIATGLTESEAIDLVIRVNTYDSKDSESKFLRSQMIQQDTRMNTRGNR